MVGILIICFKSFCNIPSIQNIISHLKEFGKQLDLIKKRTDKWKETKYASVINIVQKQKCQIKSTKADQQLWCAGNNWASLKQLEWSVVPTSRVGLLATLSIHKTVSIYYLHILHPLRYFFLYIYLSTVHDTLQFSQIQSFAFLLTCQNIQKSFMNCRQSKKLVCVLPCTKLS